MPINSTALLDNLCAVAEERPPWNIDAIDWLVSHGLIVECTMGPPHNWTYWELTDVGSRIYHNVCSHFKTILDAHHEAGQLKPVEGIEPNGRKKVHDNSNEQDLEARDVTGLTQQETATFIAEGTRRRHVGSTDRNIRGSGRRKGKG